jgi:hypothetical protein
MKTQTFLLWSTRQRIWMLAAIALVAAYSGSAIAADRIEGSVNGSGGPIGGGDGHPLGGRRSRSAQTCRDADRDRRLFRYACAGQRPE